jgi:hypothetical protein
MPYMFHQPVGGIIPRENFAHIQEARDLLNELQADRLKAAVNYGADTIDSILTRAWKLVAFLPKEVLPPTNVRTFTINRDHFVPA